VRLGQRDAVGGRDRLGRLVAIVGLEQVTQVVALERFPCTV